MPIGYFTQLIRFLKRKPLRTGVIGAWKPNNVRDLHIVSSGGPPVIPRDGTDAIIYGPSHVEITAAVPLVLNVFTLRGHRGVWQFEGEPGEPPYTFDVPIHEGSIIEVTPVRLEGSTQPGTPSPEGG